MKEKTKEQITNEIIEKSKDKLKSSIFKPITPVIENPVSERLSEFDLRILDLMKESMNEVKSITEFNVNELRSISILETNEYVRPYIAFYLANKKHIKRKYSPEIISVFKAIAETFNSIKNGMQNQMYMQNMNQKIN